LRKTADLPVAREAREIVKLSYKNDRFLHQYLIPEKSAYVKLLLPRGNSKRSRLKNRFSFAKINK